VAAGRFICDSVEQSGGGGAGSIAISEEFTGGDRHSRDKAFSGSANIAGTKSVPAGSLTG
jgi:hypothetical protein